MIVVSEKSKCWSIERNNNLIFYVQITHTPHDTSIPFRFNPFESIKSCTECYVYTIIFKVLDVGVELKYRPSLLHSVE